MTKTIKIKIFPDGQVQATANGIKGKSCTNYIRILEEILDAETIESEYTPEYHESEILFTEQNEEQKIEGLEL